MFSDIFRTVKTSFIFTFKDSKTWGKSEDRLPTSSCPAATTLPCQDSATLVGCSSSSLGEATSSGGWPSLALERVTNDILLNSCFPLVLCFMFKC